METISGGERAVTEDFATEARTEGESEQSLVESGGGPGVRAETGLRDRVAYLLVGVLVIGFAFWWTQFSTRSICCGDFDAYYHFRWSRMLEEGVRSGNFPPPFEALPLTTLNSKDYVDHHFLFHVLQIPFTWFGDATGAARSLLVLCLLAAPLLYALALRLIRNGNRHFVAGLTAATSGLVVLMALIQTRGGTGWKLLASAITVAVVGLCGWLTLRLMGRGNARPVAALAALTFVLLPPMAFYRATVFFQARAVDFFADDPYANFHYGAKLGTWLFAALALFSCYWLVVRYRLRYPLLWLLALVGCSTPFLYRMNMGKAMSVSIVMLVAGIHLLFQRRYFWLLPLAYVFALTYDMVFLLGVAAFLWLWVTVWGEDWEVTSRPVRRAGLGLLLVGAGAALGFVINPYFPHNVVLTYQHMLMKITPNDFSTAVGGEWYPYNTWEFLGNGFVACVAMVAGYVAFSGADRKASARSLFLLLFATVLLVVNARWKRFSEYWPPFAVLFAAFALQPSLERLGRFGGEMKTRTVRYLEYGMAVLTAAVLAVPAVWATHIAAKDIAGMDPNDQYLGGMQWVKENVPEGEVIFNTDWDDFPKMFFYAPRHRYASGLDPTYLQDRDRELSDLYGKIGVGDEPDPGPAIRERFGARYVFSDNQHERFMQNAMSSGWFEQVYKDDDCTILRVLDEKKDPEGERPPEGEESGEPAG